MLNLVSESSYRAILLNEFFRSNRQCRKDKGRFNFSLGRQKVPVKMPFRNIRTNEWFDTSSVIGDYRTELLSKHGELFQFDVDALCFSS
jgi:hypothetical protein